MCSWRCFPFVDSTPRAYRLKASNAAPLISTSAGTFPDEKPLRIFPTHWASASCCSHIAADFQAIPVAHLQFDDNSHKPFLRVPLLDAPCFPLVENGRAPPLTSTTLADLLTPLLVANPFSAVRPFLRWWASDCFEDGVTYRWQGGLRRRSVDSFFPAVLF